MILFVNENFPKASTLFLRKAGYHVISVQETMHGSSDELVLAKAHKESLILLTFDRDYGELIYKDLLPVPLGLIYFRLANYLPLDAANIFLKLVENKELQLEGFFTIVEDDKIRQRKLPNN
jgi:predicted nuclease of predicted toxin-antitoxin system